MTTRIAIITGGSRGLGRSAALELARHGVGIVLTYHREAAQAERVVGQIERAGAGARALALDVGDSGTFAGFAAQVRAALAERWGAQRFHYLLNNAGAGVHASFAETSEAQFTLMMNTHLKGPFFLTQALLPLLADGGRILNVSSGLTRFSTPGYAAYATMKGGIEVLTRYLARELGPRGITVNTLAPGAIATDFGGGQVRDNPALNAMIAAQTALGRVGEPEDIGRIMAALLHGELGWINGQRIEAAGGVNL